MTQPERGRVRTVLHRLWGFIDGTRRLVLNLLFLAVVVALVAAASREVVIPQVRHAFARNAQDLRGDRWRGPCDQRVELGHIRRVCGRAMRLGEQPPHQIQGIRREPLGVGNADGDRR